MKKLMIVPLILFLAACSGNQEESDAYGTFEATELTVSAEVPGKILMLNADEGQLLKAGEVAGIIDTIDWVLKKQLLEAQKNLIATKYPGVASQIAVQQQQLKNLETEKDRIEKLFRDGAATRKQLDDINGSIDVVKAQIRSIETQNTSVGSELTALLRQIDQVDENLKRCQIVTPVEGTVIDKYAEAGELTGTGKALFKIANLSEMYLRVYVSEAQLSAIKIGDKVDVLFDNNAGKINSVDGEVSWISSTAEFTPKIIQTREERVNLVYAVKIRVKNDGSIKIGMPGEIRFRN